MNPKLKTVLLLLLLPLIAFILYFSGILIINSVADYRPVAEKTAVSTEMPSVRESKTTFSILSWNIGYGGLGREADFFYDGGSMVIPPKDHYERYFSGILETLSSLDSIDFILLQEVDTFSTRSYQDNQYEAIGRQLDSHAGFFVRNYDVAFVPMPVFNPMGRVVSGLCIFSSCPVAQTEMLVFPGSFPWPKRLFMPDRCFLASRIPLPEGKGLVVINTHNSAFDDGRLRNAQLQMLKDYMEECLERGDHVVAGGDWNLNPPGYDNGQFASGEPAFSISVPAGKEDFISSGRFAFQPAFPTNRDVSGPYVPGQTPATIIDFFVCSPGIRIVGVKTLYNHFDYSDHHPVYMRFELTGNGH